MSLHCGMRYYKDRHPFGIKGTYIGYQTHGLSIEISHIIENRFKKLYSYGLSGQKHLVNEQCWLRGVYFLTSFVIRRVHVEATLQKRKKHLFPYPKGCGHRSGTTTLFQTEGCSFSCFNSKRLRRGQGAFSGLMAEWLLGNGGEV